MVLVTAVPVAAATQNAHRPAIAETAAKRCHHHIRWRSSRPLCAGSIPKSRRPIEGINGIVGPTRRNPCHT
jgi:hypothetical protein